MDKESVLLDSEDRMDKALGALDRDFSRLRTAHQPARVRRHTG